MTSPGSVGVTHYCGIRMQAPESNIVSQLSDSPDLLRLMLSEQSKAEPIFQTTNYWRTYEQRLVPYLLTEGLTDFRKGRRYLRGGEVLNSFGAGEPPPSRSTPIPRWARLFRRAISSLGRPDLSVRIRERFEVPLEGHDLRSYWREVVSVFEKTHVRFADLPISELEISQVGSPGSGETINGHFLTNVGISMTQRLEFAARHVDFRRVHTVAELNPGLGTQAEVIAKLFPRMTLVLFDIPPQLYVSHQYLSHVFGERVVPFDPSAHLDPYWAPQAGKIHLLGNWQFEILKKIDIDLFWSAAGLGEMEPHVVAHYLSIVNQVAPNVYLLENLSGRSVASRTGHHGVLKQSTFEDYEIHLQGLSLVAIDDVPVLRGPVDNDWKHAVWARQ